MRILVTGSAGFVGFHVTRRLLDDGHEVLGLDCVNDYYDVSLKEARLERLRVHPAFRELRCRLEDGAAVAGAFARFRPRRVVHLAAQAGVRHSLENPRAYVDANLLGFLHVLEGCRHGDVEHLVYASSSSVYGANARLPFREDDNVDHPLSFYAATKKANELMAHSYSHLYGMPCTGLRFFTAYGPWGRPDMALFRFTRCILEGRPIEVYNHGRHRRDFTYIDDIVEGLIRALGQVARPDPSWDPTAPGPATSAAPWRIFNIGSQRPVELLRYIELIEACLGREADKRFEPLQPGDVPDTVADLARLREAVDYAPRISVEVGVRRFVEWYRDYYGAAPDPRPTRR